MALSDARITSKRGVLVQLCNITKGAFPELCCFGTHFLKGGASMDGLCHLKYLNNAFVPGFHPFACFRAFTLRSHLAVDISHHLCSVQARENPRIYMTRQACYS